MGQLDTKKKAHEQASCCVTLVRVSSCVQSVASYLFSFISQSRTRNLPGRKSQQAVPLKTKRNKKNTNSSTATPPAFMFIVRVSFLFSFFHLVASVRFLFVALFSRTTDHAATHISSRTWASGESQGRARSPSPSRVHGCSRERCAYS